jgi:hypothetical protein
MMVLTFEGARSGRVYSFPVGYAEDAEGLVTFTRFAWWKNFREGRPVSLRLRGREMRGTAVAVRDQEQVAERFAYYLRRNPHDGKYFGVRVDRDGRANPEELVRGAARLVMVRIFLQGAPIDSDAYVTDRGRRVLYVWSVLTRTRPIYEGAR